MASNVRCLHSSSNTIPRGYDSLRRAMGTFWETNSRGSWVADVQHYLDNFVDSTLDVAEESHIAYALIEGQVAVSPFALLSIDATKLSSTYCVYLNAGSLSPASYILPRVRAYVSAGARNLSILVSGQSDLLIFVPSLMKEVRDNNWGGDVHHITVTLWVDLHHPDVFALSTRPDIQALCYGDRESLCLGILVPGFLKQYVRLEDWKTHDPMDMFVGSVGGYAAPPPPLPRHEHEINHDQHMRETRPGEGGNIKHEATRSQDISVPFESSRSGTDTTKLGRKAAKQLKLRQESVLSQSGKPFLLPSDAKDHQQLGSQRLSLVSEHALPTKSSDTPGEDPHHRQHHHKLCIWSTVSFGVPARASALSLYRKYGKLYERSYRTLVENGSGSTAHVASFMKHLVHQSLSTKLQVRVLDRDALYEQCQARPPLPGTRNADKIMTVPQQQTDRSFQTQYYRHQFRTDSTALDSESRVVVPSHCGEAPMMLSDKEEVVVVATFVVYPNVLSKSTDYNNSLLLAKRIGDEALKTLQTNVRLAGHPANVVSQYEPQNLYEKEQHPHEPQQYHLHHIDSDYSRSRMRQPEASQIRNILDDADDREGNSRVYATLQPRIRWQTIVGVIGVSSALSRMDFLNTPVVDRETIAHLTTPLLPFVYPLAGTLVSHLWDVSEGVWTFQSPIRYLGDSRLASSSSKPSQESTQAATANSNSIGLNGSSRYTTDGPRDQSAILSDTTAAAVGAGGGHSTAGRDPVDRNQDTNKSLIPLIEQSFRDWSAGRHLDSDISVAEQSRRYMLEYLSQSNQESICSHLGLLLRAVSGYFLSPTNIRIGISSWDLTPRQPYGYAQPGSGGGTGPGSGGSSRQETVYDLISDNFNSGCVVILPEIYPFTFRGQPEYTNSRLHGGALDSIPRRTTNTPPTSPRRQSSNSQLASTLPANYGDPRLTTPPQYAKDFLEQKVGTGGSIDYSSSKFMRPRLWKPKQPQASTRSLWTNVLGKLFGAPTKQKSPEEKVRRTEPENQNEAHQPPVNSSSGASSVSGKVIDSILIRASEALDKAMDGFEKTYISRNKGVPGGLAWQRL